MKSGSSQAHLSHTFNGRAHDGSNMGSRHWLYFGGVVTSVLVVGSGLMGVLEGVSALSGSVPASEEFVLLAMLGAAAEWIVIALVLALVAALFLVATIGSVLRAASLPRDDRLVSIVERLERHYPILRQFDGPTDSNRRLTTESRRSESSISMAR